MSALNPFNPFNELQFPVVCSYPGCEAGPFLTAVEVDEHITEEHLPEAIWTFALEQMIPATQGNNNEPNTKSRWV